MSNANILIVEDEEELAHYTQILLKNLGYDVAAVVTSGEEAVSKAAETQPDLILMDILLRGKIDGIEAAERIRARFDIPIIYISAHADSETLKRAKITEPFGYLIKPFQRRELHSTLEMALYKRNVEKSLKDKERWLATTLNSLADAVIATNSQGIITFMNPAAESLTGWKLDYASGKYLKEAFNIISKNTASLDEAENPAAKVIREGVIVSTSESSTLIGKYGVEIPIDYTASPITDDKDNVTGVVLVFRDVSERKKAEQALLKARDELEVQVQHRTQELVKINKTLQDDIIERKKIEDALAEEKERLSVTLRSIGDGVLVADMEGKVILMNEVAEKLTGWNQAEAFGKPSEDVLSLVDERTRERCANPVERAIKKCHTVGLDKDTILLSRGGEEAIISATSSPIYDRHGAVVGVVLVFRDLTKRRKLEHDLLRTQKLESLGTLAGGIAHDFNNLLTGILGNISLSKIHMENNERVYKKLTEAEKVCIRASSLTRKLLSFSKGGMPVKKTISLRHVIKESASFAAGGSNAIYDFSIPEDLWFVEADEGQISQAVHNLIVNAQQSMPDGGLVKINAENVHISAEHKMPLRDGDYVKVVVEDNGVGIPQEHLPWIFDPYFTTKKGAGIGLAIVYSTVKNHYGYVDVESKLGQGTKFYMYLPASGNGLSESRVIFLEEKVERRKGLEKAFIDDRGKILVMEDEEMLRNIAHEILSHVGYEVELAKNGSEAIELYVKARETDRPFDAIILDLTVPGGMGGGETLQKLLEIDPSVKAMVSSGYSDDPMISEFRRYGFKGVVAKPYRIEELTKAVLEVVNRNE